MNKGFLFRVVINQKKVRNEPFVGLKSALLSSFFFILQNPVFRSDKGILFLSLFVPANQNQFIFSYLDEH
jgi:hypothetical protein